MFTQSTTEWKSLFNDKYPISLVATSNFQIPALNEQEDSLQGGVTTNHIHLHSPKTRPLTLLVLLQGQVTHQSEPDEPGSVKERDEIFISSTDRQSRNTSLHCRYVHMKGTERLHA
jgi:hypothetical protein